MAKRLRDTEMWKKKWFRELPIVWKCFVDYMLSMCDLAGIWDVDFGAASFNIGENISECEIPIAITEQLKIQKLSENKWFIEEFIPFQYGDIKEDGKMYKAIKKVLDRYGIDTLSILYRYRQEQEQEHMQEHMHKQIHEFVPPSFHEFENYCKENSHINIAKRAYEGYAAASWHDSKGDKIRNWKQKLQHVWFKEDNKDAAAKKSIAQKLAEEDAMAAQNG